MVKKIITKTIMEIQMIKKTDYRVDWYQDGDYSHDKDGKNESVEQFVVTFNKDINPNKGSLKIIVPDKIKKDPYGVDKLGEIEVKMDGASQEKALANVKGGEKVTCFIRPDDAVESKNRFVLELTQDWDLILNTEKTGIHYYDDKVKGLRLIGEGLEDEKGNIIEDNEGTGKITADRDIELYKDDSKPYVVGQKLIYDKIGSNGVQKAGSLGVVFNEPIQLYTKEMADDGVIPPVIYKDHNPLTPSPSQIGTYDNFLPELKVQFQKVDEKGNILKDEDGNDIVVGGSYDLIADILPADTKANELQKALSIKMDEISFDFDLDKNTSGINRFRDYGLFYITPETSLTEGNWRVLLGGVLDDAGNEMDEYISRPFQIKPLFSIESLTKEGIKIKFTEPFTKNDITGDGITLVVTKYGEIVNSVYLPSLKEGQTEAEGKFLQPMEELEGEYFINNIRYTVSK
ncbi:hypothetical protein BD780_000762 [Clostridium tetanomorphum]|uniref:Uncharacterized protein n=1 Tax=Clostridium tetanomorphum TaxID=1553 RepID=A0A923E7W9_CLOTT|nr:hypothetical protein [Clostridium tetanomorphum]KAJ50964.1 hypothetical protein CTM_15113 [Clostridium tetanomorphum DSM 665]MBC2396331.1 hypothetical protein [Clostridium tetanomorphum]MBP1863440.1 hypothetical protein [Clostridium tetanomorphum]NRS83537.1 hypothetical protein [Clostridium tetanomorphum]NRZ96737.1 hypothetical protein [Clostridium tetanomorphum]